MFVFGQRVRLALGDCARRTGLRAAACGALLIAAGFLIAALWSALAYGLGWGAIYASLAIGLVFLLIGLALLMLGGQPRHQMPSARDLRQEVGMQASMMTDALAAQARNEAYRLVGKAKARASAFARGEGREKARPRRPVADRPVTDRPVTDRPAADPPGKTESPRPKKAPTSNTANIAIMLAAFSVGAIMAAKMAGSKSAGPKMEGRRGDAPDEPGDGTENAPSPDQGA